MFFKRYNALLQGPALQLWYMRLAKFKAKSSYVQTAKKVAADQLVAAPVILCTVMSSVSLMEGHNVEQTKEKLKNDYFEVLLTNYKVRQFSDLPLATARTFTMQTQNAGKVNMCIKVYFQHWQLACSKTTQHNDPKTLIHHCSNHRNAFMRKDVYIMPL